MDNFNKKKVNPNEFITRYNSVYKKSFVFTDDLKKKKSVSVKTIINSFIPILKKDWMKSMNKSITKATTKKATTKTTKKKGGNLVPPATDTITNAVQQENQNNFFNYFSRAPDFTSVYNKQDLLINQIGNNFPEISNYSRSSF